MWEDRVSVNVAVSLADTPLFLTLAMIFHLYIYYCYIALLSETQPQEIIIKISFQLYNYDLSVSILVIYYSIPSKVGSTESQLPISFCFVRIIQMQHIVIGSWVE
jgi:hypothetical protein